MNEKRERGTGRLFLRGTTFWCQYYHRGLQIRVSTKQTDERKARNFLRDRLAEVRTGTHTGARNLRYRDLRDAHLADYQVNKRKSLRCDEEGKARLDAVTRLNDFFDGCRADEIGADLIRAYIKNEQARGLSNGSINRSVSALRRMFHLAMEEGKLRSVPYFPMLKEAAPRKGFVEQDSYKKLRAKLPEYLRLPLDLGFFTGMRLGEVLSLRWEQIDFLSGAIHLYAGETKNDGARQIPLVPQLRTALVGQHATRQAGCPYVCFRLDRRGHAVKIGGFRKAWQSACIKAGLGKMEPVTDETGEPILSKPRVDRPRSKPKAKMTYRGLIFHDLRRSAVRNLVRAGVPETVARQITGHKTRSVFDRYNIVSESDLANAGRQLATFFENGDKTGTVLHQNAASVPANDSLVTI